MQNRYLVEFAGELLYEKMKGFRGIIDIINIYINKHIFKGKQFY